MKKYIKEYINTNYKFDKVTMLGIISLIIVISGIFGFLYEVVFYYMNSGFKEIYWRGGNFLPWINIYAYGALIICILTYKIRKSPFKVFFISMISCGILEFFSGYFIYDILNISPRCWDYNKEILNLGNIGGFVCFRSVIFFGLSGLLLIYVIVPFCFYLANKIPKKIFVTFSVSLCLVFLFDEIYNLIITKIFNLKRASVIYKKIGLKYIYFK